MYGGICEWHRARGWILVCWDWEILVHICAEWLQVNRGDNADKFGDGPLVLLIVQCCDTTFCVRVNYWSSVCLSPYFLVNIQQPEKKTASKHNLSGNFADQLLRDSSSLPKLYSWANFPGFPCFWESDSTLLVPERLPLDCVLSHFNPSISPHFISGPV